jgi:hypothetical protein
MHQCCRRGRAYEVEFRKDPRIFYHRTRIGRSRAYTRDSILSRTATAASRSGFPSMNCTTVLKASREASPGRSRVLWKLRGKGLILVHGAHGVAYVHIQFPYRVDSTRYTCCLLYRELKMHVADKKVIFFACFLVLLRRISLRAYPGKHAREQINGVPIVPRVSQSHISGHLQLWFHQRLLE